jgi:hypothetical protein
MSTDVINRQLTSFWLHANLSPGIAANLNLVFRDCSIQEVLGMSDSDINRKMDESPLLKKQHKKQVLRLVHEARNWPLQSTPLTSDMMNKDVYNFWMDNDFDQDESLALHATFFRCSLEQVINMGSREINARLKKNVILSKMDRFFALIILQNEWAKLHPSISLPMTNKYFV